MTHGSAGDDTRRVAFRNRVPLRALGLSILLACSRPSVADPSGQAEVLYRRALVEVKRDTFDSRRVAMQLLERATRVAPDSVAYQIELARLYYRMGFLGLARHRYERAEALDPRMAEAHLGQGLAWRRDFLKYLEGRSLERSVRELEEASRLAPEKAEAWLDLVPLLVEQGRLPQAMDAATHALAADASRPEGLLAVAHTSFRMGAVERADSAFRRAIPRLSRVARERFLDIAPLASEADTAALRLLPPTGQQTFLDRFWKDHDPDLSTPENEAQLEYWSRVTQAYFLFFNPRRQEWDQRGEVYVRYGPPEKAEYNPVGNSLYLQKQDGGITYTNGLFPMNVLVWSYPGLGMTVSMQDRILSEYYLPPISLSRSTDPAPDPDSLARRVGTLATAGGRGVFPLLPPGAHPIPVSTALARFQAERQPRLRAWVESPGAPGDSLWGEWVVLDSSRTEVARMRRLLSSSACDVSDLAAADFATELPAGEYLAGLSVRASGGRRGVARATVTLGAPAPRLELSDLVVVCGAPLTERDAAGQPSVRLSANPSTRVAGDDPLTAYFEAYHLLSGGDGRVRLEFEYTVRSAERDPRIWLQRLIAPRRSIPDISAHRQEEQTGEVRRQFVSVPVQSLPPGRYRLEIRVRDLNAGTEAARAAEFVKERGSGS